MDKHRDKTIHFKLSFGSALALCSMLNDPGFVESASRMKLINDNRLAVIKAIVGELRKMDKDLVTIAQGKVERL